ncbi:hypothetical protein QUF63_08710 [Anaerolineales bacterium HSG25]|nr:hypothetical protein [Anaerolineales bacterium HSG25]
MFQQFRYFKPIITISLIMLISGLIISCGSTSSIPIPATPTKEVEVAVVPPPTPTTPAVPTSVPAILAPDDSCVNCHSDEVQLLLTSATEEVEVELSEGEG